MKNTELRRINPSHWYTTDQMSKICSFWQNNSQETETRLFLISEDEEMNTVKFSSQDIPKFTGKPIKIVLPLNRGNAHWTAITVHIQAKNDIIRIRMHFMDSGNRNLKNKNLKA